jgi:hypothetical protein
MTKRIKSYRFELMHGDDADFIAYQRKLGDGVWQTVSVWMIRRRRFAKAERRTCDGNTRGRLDRRRRPDAVSPALVWLLPKAKSPFSGSSNGGFWSR